MKKVFLGIFLGLILVLIAGCVQQEEIIKDTEEIGNNPAIFDEINDQPPEEESFYQDVSPEKAKELIETKPGLIVIDVSPDYDQGHLPGAVNYYLGDGSLDAAIPSLDPESEYLVYCHVDSAAISGAQKLIEAGFKTVYRLEGNYAAWVEAGYEIEK